MIPEKKDSHNDLADYSHKIPSFIFSEKEISSAARGQLFKG